MTTLAERLNLSLCQDRVNDSNLITHLNAQNPTLNNQLDYILSNCSSSKTETHPEAWTNSDHVVISTIIELKNLARKESTRHKRVTIINKEIDPSHFEVVFLDPDWPEY